MVVVDVHKHLIKTLLSNCDQHVFNGYVCYRHGTYNVVAIVNNSKCFQLRFCHSCRNLFKETLENILEAATGDVLKNFANFTER